MITDFAIPLLVAAAFTAHSASASVLTEKEIFYRCYSQFVRARPSATDPILEKISSGQLKATDACLKILSEADLNEKGTFASVAEWKKRAAAVLRTFQSFHMTWFPAKELIRQETETPSVNLFDVNEPGYHLTYNLFAKEQKYSDIVTRPYSFRGIRYSREKEKFIAELDGPGKYLGLNDFKWATGKKGAFRPWNPKLISFGQLEGIRAMEKGQNPIRVEEPWTKTELDFDATDSIGAGILGTIPYVLMNTTQNGSMPSDGGLNMHRSWSKAVFSDLLCRTLPVARLEDVKKNVEPESYLPFRKKAECMQCHSTMDPFAGTLRNFEELRTAGIEGDVFSPRVLAQLKATLPDNNGVPPENDKFYLHAPKGKLFFRNYLGALINKDINGLTELGAEIARQDDLYICAAKRYFHFMTGIDVELGDFSQPPLSETDPATKVYQDFVIQLGLHLRNHQSLKKLVEEILRSKFYSLSDYGASP